MATEETAVAEETTSTPGTAIGEEGKPAGETGAEQESATDSGKTGKEGEPAGKEADGEKADGDGESKPDAYADFNLPEGIELDSDALENATPILKELGATQEQAQKLVDLAAGMVQAGAEKQTEAFSQLVEGWGEQAKKDPEIGGEAFEQNVKIAQSALEKFGTPELKQLMTEYGIGNHPEIIRFMTNVGKLTQEDQPGKTGAASNPQQDRVSILYPNG